MAIDNNILLINGTAIRPVPQFSIDYETFKSGEYIIGGVILIRLEGQIFGTSLNDLRTKVQTISSYSSKCQTIKISCGSSTVIDGVGYIRNVTINSGDQPYSATYTMEIEVAKNYGTQAAVKKDQAFSSLYGLSIPDNVILKSYEESLNVNGDNSLGNTALYNNNGFTKAHLKLSGSISIAAYHHTCDTFSPDLTNQLYTIVSTRIQKMLSFDSQLKTAYPVLSNYTGFSLVHDNKSITIDKLNNKIDWKFDVYLYKGSCSPIAITDLSISESRDQRTGMHTISLKGSVTGLNNKTSAALDNRTSQSDKIANARTVAQRLMNRPAAEYYDVTLIGGCLNAASRPPNTCFQRMTSSLSENVHQGVVNVDMVWGDTENCEVGGTTIDVNIQEDFATYKHVEHILPGLGNSIVQIGVNQTLPKATVSVGGNLTSCNIDDVAILESCVRNKFYETLNAWGYNNWFKTKEVISSSKYTYKITQTFIWCS